MRRYHCEVAAEFKPEWGIGSMFGAIDSGLKLSTFVSNLQHYLFQKLKSFLQTTKNIAGKSSKS